MGAEEERDGDEPVERLVEEKYASIRDYVRRRWRTDLERKESPSDIVQSVCRRALAAARAVRLPNLAAGTGWLRRIADNVMREKFRRWTADRRDVGQERPSLPVDAVTDGHDALDDAVVREREERLRAAIDRLPDAQRDVMRLCRLEGLPREEVARRLGRSVDAVDGLLRRAHVALAGELTREE